MQRLRSADRRAQRGCRIPTRGPGPLILLASPEAILWGRNSSCTASRCSSHARDHALQIGNAPPRGLERRLQHRCDEAERPGKQLEKESRGADLSCQPQSRRYVCIVLFPKAAESGAGRDQGRRTAELEEEPRPSYTTPSASASPLAPQHQQYLFTISPRMSSA